MFCNVFLHNEYLHDGFALSHVNGERFALIRLKRALEFLLYILKENMFISKLKLNFRIIIFSVVERLKYIEITVILIVLLVKLLSL